MRVYRVVPILVLFVLLSGGQVPLLPGQAYAQMCCQIYNCRPGCKCGCSSRVQACVDQLIGDQFTIKTNQGMPVEIEAEDAVLKQLLDLRGKGGKIACGTYTLRMIGSVEGGVKLMCTNFKEGGPNTKEKDIEAMTAELEQAIKESKRESASNSMNK